MKSEQSWNCIFFWWRLMREQLFCPQSLLIGDSSSSPTFRHLTFLFRIFLAPKKVLSLDRFNEVISVDCTLEFYVTSAVYFIDVWSLVTPGQLWHCTIDTARLQDDIFTPKIGCFTNSDGDWHSKLESIFIIKLPCLWVIYWLHLKVTSWVIFSLLGYFSFCW